MPNLLRQLLLALARNLAARGQLDAAGRALYDSRDYRATPVWDQLGHVTKSVWTDRLM